MAEVGVKRRDKIAAIADAWHKRDPGWNTAPARRELAAVALHALESLERPERRGTLLSPQEFFPLDQWARQLTEAFSETPYLVGSAANGKKDGYRDVDVRMLCPKGGLWITRTETRRLTINLAVTTWCRHHRRLHHMAHLRRHGRRAGTDSRMVGWQPVLLRLRVLDHGGECGMTPTKVGNVLSWATDIEDSTIEQAQKAAGLPFVEGHLALMPDAHIGIGATIGSVIPTRGAIVPAAVGVDIGCGMIAARTSLKAKFLPDNLDALMPLVSERIPAGLGKWHDNAQALPGEIRFGPPKGATDKQKSKIAKQFGTLGSGNHFVEVCLDENEDVWVVLHSGSRGIGNELAKVHIDGAKKLMKRYFIELEDPDLAYLVQNTAEFDHYISDMLWSQSYALANREAMMDAALRSLFDVAGRGHTPERINCHHNFTTMENHHGKNLWITRKGAIKADVGDLGVIPGSMGTRSYIVRGLGNPASYNSCSHGAGRRLSRGAARRELTEDSLREAMVGKTWNEADAKTLLDESPAAYKDIDVVMADQKDLVEIVHTLSQVFNYKGT